MLKLKRGVHHEIASILHRALLEQAGLDQQPDEPEEEYRTRLRQGGTRGLLQRREDESEDAYMERFGALAKVSEAAAFVFPPLITVHSAFTTGARKTPLTKLATTPSVSLLTSQLVPYPTLRLLAPTTCSRSRTSLTSSASPSLMEDQYLT